MVEVTKFATVDEQRPGVVVGRSYDIVRRISVVSGDCPQNDEIKIQDIPVGHQVVDSMVRHSATLGASATAKLRVGTTAITAASSAGAASAVRQNAVAPYDGAADQSLNVLIEGAAITASADITVWARVVDMKVAG